MTMRKARSYSELCCHLSPGDADWSEFSAVRRLVMSQGHVKSRRRRLPTNSSSRSPTPRLPAIYHNSEKRDKHFFLGSLFDVSLGAEVPGLHFVAMQVE